MSKTAYLVLGLDISGPTPICTGTALFSHPGKVQAVRIGKMTWVDVGEFHGDSFSEALEIAYKYLADPYGAYKWAVPLLSESDRAEVERIKTGAPRPEPETLRVIEVTHVD